ncbi:putative transcription factor B3-Domain family [Medicago truncatula]|uniref:Putative transcription factor B3-Domain family n=1 Tax=Medicago truncatula TaxID=3880 RepID=A0A396HFD3_MEDTR|nr:putative transcription factor B3-Domain family [Medicago truncatula]
MIPRNFVERYWKDVSNPISLKFPNKSQCKMNWEQRGDDIWLLNWKRFARSLRCGDLLVFQYKGGSDFHVIIFDVSKLEIDYSSIGCNDNEENNKESDDDYDVEIPSDSENTKISINKKRINLNDIATTAATPQGTNIHKRKTNINATQQNVSGKLIYFLLFI